MSNLLVVLIYASLMLISMALLIPICFRQNKSKLDYVYIGMCVFIILWQITDILIYSVSDPALILYLDGARFAPIACIPGAFFFLVAVYYNQFESMSIYIKSFFFIGAAIIVVLALTTPFHNFFWDDLSISSMSPLLIFIETRNIGFYLVTVGVQIPIIGILIITLTQRRILPKQYRSSTTIFLSSLVLYAFAVVLFAIGVFRNSGFDAVLIVVTMVNFFLYLAIIKKERGDYLNVWLGDVFNALDKGILIINEREVIVEANETAKKIFENLNIDTNGIKARELFDRINRSGISFMRCLASDQAPGKRMNMYIFAGEYPVIYEITESTISSKGRNIGKYLILSDVTRNRLYIERLQALAGVDPLTDLLNRYSYENVLREWDTIDSLPLTLIIGDVNDLKKINDSWGHKAGDELLERSAKILQAHCPEGGKVARIGGDEFVVVLRRHDESDAARIINDIRCEIAGINDSPYPVSIALGSATKHSSEENINALYAAADACMYENKKQKGEAE